MKKRYLIIITVLILLSVNVVSAYDFSNETISHDNSNDVLGDSSASFTTLKDEIASTPSEGVLELNKSYVYNASVDTVISKNLGIVMGKSITIDGKGHTIDGCNLSKIFTINRVSDVTLKNIIFKNAFNTGNGGAISVGDNSDNFKIDNCSFINCSTTFDTYGSSSGGALEIRQSNNVWVTNCNFTDCKSTGIGGTIRLDGSNNVVENSLIENSRGSYGGAIYISGQNSAVNNTKIINASATNYGGAILLSDQYSGVYNTTISDSSAAYGGAIFMGSTLGRGGHNGKIYNSTIDNCHATSNGGAVYLNGNYQDIVNSTFTNNVADGYGGAIYSNSTENYINNSYMDGNNASVGSAIFKAGNYDTYINNVVFGANRANSSSLSINKEKRKFSNTFRGFDNILNAIWNNGTFNTIFIDGVNPVDGAQNSDGGKLLYEDNREFNQTIIVSVLDENGNVLYTKSLKTGLYGEVNFTTYLGEKIQFSHPDDRFYTGISNSAPIPKLFVTGENKTSYVNQKVDIPVRVFDEFNDTVGEGTLSITIGGETFTVPANSTNVTITAPSTGGLYDLTITYTDPYGLTLSNKSSLFVWDPKIDVTKKAVNPVVVLKHRALFEINVTNTGNKNLSGVFVSEEEHSGLKFIDYSNHDEWTYSFNNKHTWTLNKDLNVGESVLLFVTFDTDSVGKFINKIISGSTEALNKTAEANLTVIKSNLTVDKDCLTPIVVLGDQAIFKIIVNNTGKVDLSDVRVYEDSFDGLVYDSYVASDRWTCQIIHSKPVWTFNDVLPAGEIVLLTVYFNTTKAGTFSNTAVVKSGKTDDVASACEVNVVKPEIKVEKICLTPSVVLGNQARFEIIVNNTGKVDLSDVRVYEDSFDGLVYDSYVASDRWTCQIINSRPVWTFNEVLPAGEWVSLFVNFNTTAEGTFTNHVKTKSNLADANGSDDVVVLKPEIGVEKITLTPNVILGDLASFEIVIHNNGRTDLTNVTVMELPDASLIYDSYLDNGLFTHGFVNGVHIWSLDKLSRGSFAGFIVYYKTTKLGIISNSVLVESNEISNKSGSNTTNVLLPSFTVEKVCLTPNVLAGNQTAFEIVIHNTGDVPLHDVYIIEDYYDGLIYDSALDDKLWTHELDGGKHKWVLNTPLQSNEFIDLFVKFNTTVSGNFTNFAIASSSETGSRLVNATVQVFDVMPEPPVTNSSNETSFDLFKTVITEEILVNGQVTFQVVIHNTCKNDLKEVILTELPPEGLIYDSFADYIDLWNYNGDLTWSANRNIRPGEHVGFFIIFNTTGEGKFANRIEVKANNSNTTDANASFDVLKPDFTVEKILVSEDIVSKGSQVAFEIVIHNSGKTSLNNLTVKEYSFDGLIYNHFVDYLNIWNLNDDLSWTMNTTLLPGEFVGFFIVFNTTDTGNFTNIVVANSSECDNRYSNASVSVLNEDFAIDMVCLNPLTILGNQVTFEITIQNTGKIPINVLNLSEFDFEGLVFDHFNDYLGHWIYNGDLIWTLNETLVSREVTSLFVVFNTTDVGNFTNIVFAEIPQEDTNELLGADEGNGKFAEAKVEVFRPEYVIEKIAINKTVSVGQQVLFEIVVKNTGRVALDDIVISESEIDGLVFNHFIDYMNVWINDGMNWRLNTSLLSGELMSLFVVYNTTQAGNFTNVISSGNLTSNAIVEVLRLEYSIEKIAINKTVTLGSQVLFEILVKNTGKVSVDDIVISESEIEGLVFDHFIDYMNVWINDGMTWRLNTALHSGEVRSLYLAYNTTKAGNITNIITSGNLTSNATVEVNDNVKPVTNPNIAVTAEIVENPIYIGNTTLVKITVTNTGDVDLDNVFVDLMLNSGLIYDSMLGNWTYNNNRFNLNTVLRVGESSTFYVSVKALTAGNLSSIAYAGFNNTQITNSTFGIEVLNKTAPANKTDNNKTDNITDNTQAKVVKGAVGNNSTGNPLVLILFALLALVSVNVRRKK